MTFKELTINGEMDESEAFAFSCRRCGACCTGDVTLTPHEFYRIAKHMSMSQRRFADRYCNVIADTQLHVPFMHINANPRCPFLMDTGCSLQHIKPYVCSLFPLGRGFGVPGPNEKSKLFGKPFFFVQPVSCPGLNASEKVIVRDFLSAQQYADIETRHLVRLMETLAAIPIRKLTDDRMLLITQLLYYDYDQDAEFFGQFQRRVQSIVTYTQHF